MPTLAEIPSIVKHFIAAILLFASAGALAEDVAENLNDPDVLWGQATLYRDEWGVPHVYADNFRAMAFAFGYAQAEDHLDPMLLAFRAVRGRSAEVLGEDRLPQDTYALQMRFDELAKAAFEDVDLDVRDLCEGFALGVNTWLLEHPAEAPDWAEGIQPHEILSLLHAFLMAHAPFDLPEADVRDPGMLSAHAWAVGPEHSTSNQAMLVINPHAQFEGIYRWYEAHLVADGYELAGATIYGLPILLAGHNPRAGWAIAPNQADIADLYDEDGFTHLKHSERYHDVFVKSGETLEKEVVITWTSENGPIVATNMNRPLAWKVGGYGQFETLGQLIDMARARNLGEFIEALNINALPAFNVVYADAEGDIYYAYNAVTGARRQQLLQAGKGAQRTIWEKPVPGYSPEFRWDEALNPAQLPSFLNPEAGYLIGSGTPPWGAATGIEWNTPPALAWLILDEDTPSSVRARQLFDRGPRSFHDMQSLLFDHAIPEAQSAIDFLLEAAAAFPELVRGGHPDLPVALDNLAEWDRIASAESTAMTWFHVWTSLYEKLLADSNTLPTADGLQKIALRAASEASRLLINTYQTPFVPWGDVHLLSRGDVQAPLSGGATGRPILRSSDATYTDGKWIADSGYAHAMIVQFSDPPSTISLVPFGASDRPDSPHYTDQMPLLTERRMKVLHTTRNDVLRAALSARGSALEFVDRSNTVRVLVTADSPVSGRLVTAHRFDRRTEDGLAAFSPFIEPVVAPGDVDITIDLVFTVPDSLCSADALEDLAVYAFHPQTGWSVVADQSLDVAERTFSARDYYDQVYVVLGPQEHLRRNPLDHPDARTLAEIPVQLLPEGPPPVRRTVQAPVHDELARALDEDADRAPPEPVRTIRPEDNPFGASPGVLVFTPDEEEAESPTGMPQVANPDLVPPRVARVPEAPAPQPEPATPVGNADSGEPGYERERRDDDTLVIRGRDADAEDTLPNRESGSRLSVSYESPVEMRGGRGPQPFELYLAPGSATASELKIGTNVDISPPVAGVILRLHSDSTIRAQGYIAELPPSPIPDGLAAFTPIVVARRSPNSQACTVAVTLRVPPTRCNPANADQLALYVHDAERGWARIESATMPNPLSYQAVDFDARTYAVLGPGTLRIE